MKDVRGNGNDHITEGFSNLWLPDNTRGNRKVAHLWEESGQIQLTCHHFLSLKMDCTTNEHRPGHFQLDFSQFFQITQSQMVSLAQRDLLR